jgi:hypothetical protein
VSKPATKDKPLLFVSKMPLFGFIRFQTKKLGYKNILRNWFGLLYCSKIKPFSWYFNARDENSALLIFAQKTLGQYERRKFATVTAECHLQGWRATTPRH